MKPAIRIEGVSKRFRLGAQKGEGYQTLREAIMSGVRAPLKHLPFQQRSQENDGNSDDFWALKDVSFEIHPGEVVGLIGRNGSGKSTLLKILSRIYEPTSGRAIIRGRVGSLLEVGTGFHPELTGRENIFLNGSIMGMSRREIQRQFDAIVAFSEIERFLDTPVKRYSSGMFVRLAFAVAAHLEPEVLFVDEVLAVGDAAFQKKCLGKMGEVSRGGRTLIFVSHNMAAVRHLCNKVVVLDYGQLAFEGECGEGIARYLKQGVDASSGAFVDLSNHPAFRTGPPSYLREIRLTDSAGNLTSRFHCGDMMAIEFLVEPPKGATELRFGAFVEDGFGNRLFSSLSRLAETPLPPLNDRLQRVVCAVDELQLAPGNYTLTFYCCLPHQANPVLISQAASFDVIESDYYGNGVRPDPSWGPFLVRSRWSLAGDGRSSGGVVATESKAAL